MDSKLGGNSIVTFTIITTTTDACNVTLTAFFVNCSVAVGNACSIIRIVDFIAAFKLSAIVACTAYIADYNAITIVTCNAFIVSFIVAFFAACSAFAVIVTVASITALNVFI